MSDQIPDEIGYIEGWRVFRYDYPSLNVTSYSETEYHWKKGANEAFCTHATPKMVLKNGPNGPEMVPIFEHGEIPDPKCGCGFWIYKDKATLSNKFSSRSFIMPPLRGNPLFAYQPYHRSGFGSFSPREEQSHESLFVGKVRAWGKVVEGEDGYRTEFCQIVSIIPIRVEDIDELKKLSDLLECDLETEMFEVDDGKKVVNVYQTQTNSQLITVTGIISSISPLQMGKTGKYRPRIVVILLEKSTTTSMGTPSTVPVPFKKSPSKVSLADLRNALDGAIPKEMELEIWNSAALKMDIQGLIDSEQNVEITAQEHIYHGKSSYMIKSIKVV